MRALADGCADMGALACVFARACARLNECEAGPLARLVAKGKLLLFIHSNPSDRDWAIIISHPFYELRFVFIFSHSLFFSMLFFQISPRELVAFALFSPPHYGPEQKKATRLYIRLSLSRAVGQGQ